MKELVTTVYATLTPEGDLLKSVKGRRRFYGRHVDAHNAAVATVNRWSQAKGLPEGYRVVKFNAIMREVE